ncbi:MAG: isoprenylcysteine carboxylmethyltransferase family protein [Anaerolineaceae bacterium]|nr:isoprenylcysteine carboxylmethyltransferase family protein [Anaerolineaceae bacterium]
MNNQTFMNSKNALAPKMIFRIIINFVVFFLVLGAIFPISGRWDWWQAWVCVGLMLAGTLLSRLIVARFNPTLIKERATAGSQANVKPWDRFLMPMVAIIFPLAIFYVAAVEMRIRQSSPIPLWANLVAAAVILFGLVFSTWAMVVNRFFSAVVRIQTDRGQAVCTHGPYRFVRHPGYFGGVVSCLAYPILLGSWWAFVPVGLYLIAIITRTALEDRTLQAELPGYLEYMRKTRFRLIPGIW